MGKSPLKAGKLALKSNILDGLRDAVILVNARREIVDFNEAAQVFVFEKHKGSDLAGAFPQKEILEAVQKVLKGKKVESLEVIFPFPVSKVFETVVTPLPSGVLDKKGWVMLALHDISAAHQADKMRSDFIANLSHELRSPLTTLTGLIESLQGPAKDNKEMQTRFLGIMEQEASRMRRLVDDLLSLSRVEAIEHIVPEGKIEIFELIEEVVSHFELRAQKKGMSLRIDGKKDWPSVRGNYDEISQVFENLISNAVKYSPDQSDVVVILEKVKRISATEGAGIAVAIKDQGEGIAPKHLERLTERFYRVDKGRSRAAGGTGLGLAVVKHILNRHRGRLEITSKEGKGSVFTVYLPLAEVKEIKKEKG
ncbi:MAG: ATP-binding protein [Rhodospirillales bacterium]|nr:ATP-binding protein [Rhodospirillales bacterium]